MDIVQEQKEAERMYLAWLNAALPANSVRVIRVDPGISCIYHIAGKDRPTAFPSYETIKINLYLYRDEWFGMLRIGWNESERILVIGKQVEGDT